jgi:hypothetical protein
MQFCVTPVILRDLAALIPQIFHSLHKITHFLTGYINSYFSRSEVEINFSDVKVVTEVEHFLPREFSYK